MKKRSNKIMFIFVSIVATSLLMIASNVVLAWDNERTHKDLSRIAAEKSVIGISDIYLNSLGFNFGLDEKFTWNGKTLKTKEWIEDGAFSEDAGSDLQGIAGTARYSHHFHNPLKPWAAAGLNDWVLLLHYTGESSLLWAQDSTKQSGWLGGDWSWKKVRDFYYFALTSATGTDRGAYFAQMFRGLGHQMHLIQDASQPDHVRNDAHPLSRNQTGGLNIEPWAAANSGLISSLATTPQMPTLSLDPSTYSLDPSYQNLNLTPVVLFIDTDQYNSAAPSTSLSQGLSEYTNANFASAHTIFAEEKQTDDIHYFPYPRKSSTDIQDYINQNKLPETVVAEDGIPDTGFWIKKTGDGENYGHFVKPTYLTDLLQGTTLYNRTLYQDTACYKDYVKFLIPRAVGYSAGLLNYFFRGNIEISLPNSGIYSSATSTAAGFTTIKVQVKNTTLSGDDMLNGSIELVVKYRLALEDPFKNYAEDYDFQVESKFTYIAASEKNGIRTIPRNNPIELTFDLPTPIPLRAVDVYLQVVYHGKLGNEDGAVAVGFKDISEPTPIDDFNNMDKICISGVWYVAGSPAAYNALPASAKYWDYWAHDLKDDYIKISPSGSPVDASASAFTFYKPLVEAGTLYRSYILSDYDFVYSGYGVMAAKDSTIDNNDHSAAIKKATAQGTGVKNQEETINDQDICESYGLTTPCTIRFSPLFYTFRGVDIWGAGGFITDGLSYPNVTDPGFIPCSWSDLSL